MKTASSISILVWFILLSGFQCQKKIIKEIDNKQIEQRQDNCLKGKLVIKALCMNYTISVISGNIDKSLIQQTWTDNATGKTYKNIFGLASYCSFPADIKEGDEFYFKIVDKSDQDCVVCMAYYPTPEKKLAIAVLKSDCTNQ